MLRAIGSSAAFFVALAIGSGSACGGDVVVEQQTASAQAGSGGNGGGSGAGGGPVACPSGPMDQAIQTLVGKPCATADEVCASNNGCGGCSVTCRNGVWTSTDASLCYSIGEAC